MVPQALAKGDGVSRLFWYKRNISARAYLQI